MLTGALNRDRGSFNATYGQEEVKIEAELREIDPVGGIFIDFSPKVVSVPNNWDKLWDLSEREKLTPDDRAEFEEALLKIMHASFIHNTEE